MILLLRMSGSSVQASQPSCARCECGNALVQPLINYRRELQTRERRLMIGTFISTRKAGRNSMSTACQMRARGRRLTRCCAPPSSRLTTRLESIWARILKILSGCRRHSRWPQSTNLLVFSRGGSDRSGERVAEVSRRVHERCARVSVQKRLTLSSSVTQAHVAGGHSKSRCRHDALLCLAAIPNFRLWNHCFVVGTQPCAFRVGVAGPSVNSERAGARLSDVRAQVSV